MKVLALIAIVAVVCVILFLIALFSPRMSRRAQAKANGKVRKLKNRSERAPEPVEDPTEKALDVSRRAINASARKGRELHDRVTGS